jgi:hypothetical protein
MTDTGNEGNASQWMKDVNDQLDLLVDDVDALTKKGKTTMLVAGAAIVLGAVQSLGIGTLFKGQKAIAETLGAIVSRLEPVPMSPEDVARAQEIMKMQASRDYGKKPNVTVDNHKGDSQDARIVTNTEVPSETADPVVTPGNPSDVVPDWVDDSVLEQLNGEGLQ